MFAIILRLLLLIAKLLFNREAEETEEEKREREST